MPAFRALGYRQVTLKALARACGLSIPGLYRYFPSKRDFAVFPLSAANRPEPNCFEPAGTDPLGHLRIWIEHGAVERADYLLALSLIEQMDDDERPSRDELRGCFEFHETLLVGFMTGAVRGLPIEMARATAQGMLAVSLGHDVILVERSVAEMRGEFVRMARTTLVSGGVDAFRFDRIMSSAPPPHICPGACV